MGIKQLRDTGQSVQWTKTFWMAVLERALEREDYRTASEAKAELERRGVFLGQRQRRRLKGS